MLCAPQISGFNKTGPKWKHPGYQVDHPIIPHGIRYVIYNSNARLVNSLVRSVALTGPAVFQFTAPSAPSRHREALAIFKGTTPSDPSIASIPDSDVGAHLYEAIARFLDNIDVPRGLKAIGYTNADIPQIVEGTLPQRRVLDLAPGIGDVAGEDGRQLLTTIIERSMSY